MARDPSREPLYRAFAEFRERCLLANRSLLWPEREVWTISTLELVRRRFVEGFIQGRMTFREKLDAQLSGAPAEAWALAADCFYIYGLPSRTIRYDTKRAWVEWAARRAGLPVPAAEDPIWEPLRLGFAVTGQKYNLKHAQLRLLVLLALEIKAVAGAESASGDVSARGTVSARGSVSASSAENISGGEAAGESAAILNSPRALQSLLDDILAAIPLKIDRANDMRNAILYLAFPDEYEPLLSNRDKDAIIRHYAAGLTGLPPGSPPPGETFSTDRDAALRLVRQALAPRFTGLDRPFDFYLDTRGEWRADLASGVARSDEAELERAIAGQTGMSRAGHTLRERGEDWPAPVDPDIQRVLRALRLTRNVILSGPPGTGKTYLAQKVAHRIAGAAADSSGSAGAQSSVEASGTVSASGSVRAQTHPPEHYTWWITLHPSYSYEDFVEGLRPRMRPSQRRNAGSTQPSESEPTSQGELAFQSLPPAAGSGVGGPDPAGQAAWQAAWQDAYEVRPGVFREVCERAYRDPQHTYVLVVDEINRANLAKILGELVTLIEDDKRGVLSARLPYSGARFTVPPNLVLLGTMNTADRSIALLDAALRRRFAFVEILPRPELLSGALVETDEAVLRLDDLLRCLNAAISEQLGPGYQVGHSYFLRVARAAHPAERLDMLDLVWNTQILPLLEEVFYSRKERLVEILAPFIEESGDPLAQREPARLHGEDLVVTLGKTAYLKKICGMACRYYPRPCDMISLTSPIMGIAKKPLRFSAGCMARKRSVTSWTAGNRISPGASGSR